MENPNKTSGKYLITIGWVLIVLSVLTSINIFQGAYQRDAWIEAFLSQPNAHSLGGVIGVIIGTNILTLAAMVFGIYGVLRKKPKGKHLFIASIIWFSVFSGLQFLPSSSPAKQDRFVPMVITVPQSEYQITFPHASKKRVAKIDDIEVVSYESNGPDANPYLRVEFMNDIDVVFYRENLMSILENHAKLTGLKLPQITESQEQLGKVGTYSGIKTVGDTTIRIYGKMVIGDSSGINCVISEDLATFPSEDSAELLSGIKRK